MATAGDMRQHASCSITASGILLQVAAFALLVIFAQAIDPRHYPHQSIAERTAARVAHALESNRRIVSCAGKESNDDKSRHDNR